MSFKDGQQASLHNPLSSLVFMSTKLKSNSDSTVTEKRTPQSDS